MLTYKIHLIRHGLTTGNLEGRYIGATDTPLCDEGRARLLELRKTCEYPAVDRVYTSPLLRARETAELLFPDRQILPEADLRELDFGAFENHTGAELENDPDFQRWIASPASACTPGGESGEALLLRASGAMERIFSDMMRERMSSVAVVTHGGLIMNLLAALGLPQREMFRWEVGNGHGYTVLLTAQMWMRDRKFEVYGTLPWPREASGEAGATDWEWI